MSLKENYIALSAAIGGPYSLITKGIKKGIVQSIMRGSMPKASELHEVAKVLGVTIEELLTGKQGAPPVAKEDTAPYSTLTDEEQEYTHKTLQLLRNKDTKKAVKEMLDMFSSYSSLDPRNKVGQRHRRRKGDKGSTN